MEYYIQFIIAALILSSCCAKKKCDYEEYPLVGIELTRFDNNYIDVITIENTSNTILDSVHYNNSRFNISHVKANDMRNKTFVSKTIKPETDTISNINYKLNTFMIPCNTRCFFDNGDAQVTDFENLQYSINGITYT